MINFFKLYLLFLIVLTTSSGEVFSQTITDPMFEEIRNDIKKWVDEEEQPSMSVAVSKGGKLLWLESIGYANKEEKIRANTSSIYGVASITKSVTATAIMILVDKGLIDLDKPANFYLKDIKLRSYADLEGSVTVRNLLNHTSGMGTYFDNVYHNESQPYPIKDSALEDYGIVLNPPNVEFSYANVGYEALGHIIEAVSGKSYEDFLQSNIFEPLQMDDTFVRIEDSRIESYVTFYGVQGEKLPLVYTDTKAAGDIYSTSHDLVKFGESHIGVSRSKTLLPDNVYELMRSDFDPDIVHMDPCNPYGLGWFFEREKENNSAFWHEGGLDGVGSILKIIPDEEVVVAVITNTTFTNSKTKDIANRIIKALVPGYQEKSCPGETSESTPYSYNETFSGTWSGNIYTSTDTLAIGLEFRENDEIVAYFSNPQTSFFWNGFSPVPKQTFLNHASVSDFVLSGWILEGMIPSDHWRYRNHIVSLNLKMDKNKLHGYARAFTSNSIREGSIADFYMELFPN